MTPARSDPGHPPAVRSTRRTDVRVEVDQVHTLPPLQGLSQVKLVAVLVEEREVWGDIARSKSVSHSRSLTTNVQTQSQVERAFGFKCLVDLNSYSPPPAGL